MVGTAVRQLLAASAPRASRKVLLGTASTAVLLVALTACATTPPGSSPSPTPSVTASDLPSATASASTAASASASPSGSPGPSASGNLGALTGSWKGTWVNESPQTAVGTFTLSWAQQGNNLFGAIGVVGSTCLSGGNVTGTVNGNSLSFGAVEGSNMINYTGTYSGNTMSGTYASACGNSKGTWSAVKA
jgi:hypothetical protein